MKQIISFIKKEMYHILRDSRTLVILLIMPLMQMILYGYALTNEVKDSKFAVWDQCQTEFSRNMIREIDAGKYFDLYKNVHSESEIENLFKENKIKLGIVIDKDFEINKYIQGKSNVQLLADASNPNEGSTVINYATTIITKYFNKDLQVGAMPQIQPEVRFLYNPELLSSFNFVPGVMAMILMLVSTMMTGVSIVKEKEMGTMEILLVSPMQPMKVIIAKMVPYFIVSFINILTILAMSVWLLDLPIKGNIFLLLMESSLFIITCLAFGFFISNVTEKQETAMFIALIGMFLPTLMLSGYMFPIENLPTPLRVISNAVPARWYYNILKNVMIKGLGFASVWKENAILIGMTLLLMILSIKKFKLRLE